MINILTPWQEWTWSNKTGEFTSITKKEEMEALSQDRNQKLQADIIKYKENNIKWIKSREKNPKPRMKIWWMKRQFDKMEPNSVEIDRKNVFKLTLQTWGFLQVNNKKIYTDKDKQRELSDLRNKKAVERTEIQAWDKLELGNDYVCSFAFMLPKNFPLLANRLVLWQWKQNPIWDATQNPLLAQRIQRDDKGIDNLVFTINNSWDLSGKEGTETKAKIPIKKLLGKRLNMEYQVKFSDNEDGYLRINMNGENILEYNWILSSSNKEKEKWTNEIYFKFGLYRDNYDYGIKLLKERNKKDKYQNLEKKIAEIEKAKKDEKNGNPMTIYFKEYSVKTIKEWENKKEENGKKTMMQDHFDEEKINFKKNIENFLEKNIGKDFFNLGKVKNYHIFTEGVSSIVARIDMEDGKKYVFKSCNDLVKWWDSKTHIETESFKIREKLWVKTPKIYGESTIASNGNDISYIIMEYIRPTKELTEENEQEIAYEMGATIAKISEATGKWFWWVKQIEKNIPIWEYENIDKYYTAFEEKVIKTLTKKNLIEDRITIKLHKAIAILQEDFNLWTRPCLTHEDIRLDNIFLTSPMTIFDPNPKIDHPLADLAWAQFYLLFRERIPWNKKEIRKKNIWAGYEQTKGESNNQNVFNACIAIKIFQKICYGFSENSEEKMQKALNMLNEIDLK